MCLPDKIDPDWVNKGFHLHIDGVELGLRPTHSTTYRDGFVFTNIFGSTRQAAFDDAARKARKCLADPEVRARWRRDLKRGMEYVRGRPGDQANGRQYEFHRLIQHLDAYEERHGNA